MPCTIIWHEARAHSRLGMADENTIVVLGIPIPSTDPFFLAIVGVHVLFGLTALIAGAVAMLSNKGRGRHSNWGTIYFRCLLSWNSSASDAVDGSSTGT